MKLTLLLVVIAVVGCAPVRPWQRATLAEAHMQFQPCADAEGQLEGVREINEGGTFSSGTSGAAGAGCGCK
jgi:hypothetical protein